MQSWYQVLLTGHTPAEVAQQFRALDYLDGADEKYYDALLAEVGRRRGDFDALIAGFADRPVEQLDPVEHAILYVALAELSASIEVPYRVVIDEAIGLARRFGGTDGHKYVNAIVDRAARELRAVEYGRR